jgi:hypothetical protein
MSQQSSSQRARAANSSICKAAPGVQQHHMHSSTRYTAAGVSSLVVISPVSGVHSPPGDAT